MFKKLYLIFGLGVIALYVASSLMGWELMSNGSRSSFFGSPYVWGGGFRGGK
jgi:hypothetical protein